MYFHSYIKKIVINECDNIEKMGLLIVLKKR